jgi:PBP1b-binding outer membrane lipoprotein LpoB
MKKLKYIAMAFAALLLASCMGDGYADSVGEKDYTGPAIGNNKLEATNVITISELKEKYATQIERGLYKQVDEDIKILGIVTGNDLGGNLYNQVCLQDKTARASTSVATASRLSWAVSIPTPTRAHSLSVR